MASGDFVNIVQKEAFIGSEIQRYINRRYDPMLMRDVGKIRIDVSVDFDFSKMAHIVRMRLNDMLAGLMVCEDKMFSVDDKLDWDSYQLDRLYPMADSMMFSMWFLAKLPTYQDKMAYKRKGMYAVSEVYFSPPHIDYSEDMFGMPIITDRVDERWTATIRFTNGASKADTLGNIQKESKTWLAIALMASEK